MLKAGFNFRCEKTRSLVYLNLKKLIKYYTTHITKKFFSLYYQLCCLPSCLQGYEQVVIQLSRKVANWMGIFQKVQYRICTEEPILLLHIHIHTYIIGHYNTPVSITTQLLTRLMLCALIFIREWRDLQFKVDSERQIFGKLFIAILFILIVFVRNLLKGNRLRNIFVFIFRFDVSPGIQTQV